MHRVSVNKNVLSSRLNSVRQMSCCRSSTGRLFHSLVRRPQNFYRRALTVFGGPYMCGHQLIRGADVLRPWWVGSRQKDTAGRVSC